MSRDWYVMAIPHKYNPYSPKNPYDRYYWITSSSKKAVLPPGEFFSDKLKIRETFFRETHCGPIWWLGSGRFVDFMDGLLDNGGEDHVADKRDPFPLFSSLVCREVPTTRPATLACLKNE